MSRLSCRPSPAHLVAAALLVAGCDAGQAPSEPDGSVTPASAAAVTAAAALSFRMLSAGREHTCGVTTDNRAFCWGRNTDGQLGDGTTTPQPRPILVTGNHTFDIVAAGDGYSCGLGTDGRVWCWGANTDGRLGDGTTTRRLSPKLVSGTRRYAQVRAGALHTCAVTGTGAAFCWGNNSAGQLGDGTTTTRLVPTRVKGGLTFNRVFTAGVHTCGATLDHKAYCWGRNEDGQLGDGTTIRKLKPTLVAGGHDFRQTAVGAGKGSGDAWSSLSCALAGDARAWCWGENHYGGVGDGSIVNRSVPSPVSGGLSFAALATGGLHTCAITTANQAYCWGQNADGQLGVGFFDGTPFTPHDKPEAVLGPS